MVNGWKINGQNADSKTRNPLWELSVGEVKKGEGWLSSNVRHINDLIARNGEFALTVRKRGNKISFAVPGLIPFFTKGMEIEKYHLFFNHSTDAPDFPARHTITFRQLKVLKVLPNDFRRTGADGASYQEILAKVTGGLEFTE